jgi:hypothetical protein
MKCTAPLGTYGMKNIMALSSFYSEKEKGDKGVLEVDWIKVYQFKQ